MSCPNAIARYSLLNLRLLRREAGNRVAGEQQSPLEAPPRGVPGSLRSWCRWPAIVLCVVEAGKSGATPLHELSTPVPPLISHLARANPASLRTFSPTQSGIACDASRRA
jgi:hypothetical protein